MLGTLSTFSQMHMYLITRDPCDQNLLLVILLHQPLQCDLCPLDGELLMHTRLSDELVRTMTYIVK